MNLFFAQILAFVLPLSLVIVPGSLLRPKTVSRAVLWSLASLVLLTYIAAVIHVPYPYIGIALFIIFAFRWSDVFEIIYNNWQPLAVGICIILLFGIPFFMYHDGLPTGDSQKAIYWAERSLATGTLPDYQSSIELLNRDPVDFYTPGLHTLTALVIKLSPLPLVSIGWFSIIGAIGVMYIGVTWGTSLISGRTIWYQLTIAFLLLTQTRFLRYLREPGYHYQNIFGELFLFGALWIACELIRRWRIGDAILFVLLLSALSLSHQFSLFLAIFTLLPPLLLATFSWVTTTTRNRYYFLGGGLILILLAVVVFVSLGLHSKIPHLFTTDAHLISLTPSIGAYPNLMGFIWLLIGLAGFALLVGQYRRRKSAIILSSTIIILLMLSQAPRLGIDIPPVRALFYTAVPLSITGGLLLETLRRRYALSISGIVLLIVVITSSLTLQRALIPTHALAVNSTLEPEHIEITQYLKQSSESGAVITDDYNQRATSWLLLSNRPTYTRLAADVSRLMAEAKQSPLRYQLYVRQLDFEKIFSLGSLPETALLMEKHGARWITGISGLTETNFEHSSALTAVYSASRIQLFELLPDEQARCASDAEYVPWLLSSRTIANDIGDAEDVFEHLPVSLRTARLSPPAFDGLCTYRTTTAPLIPLRFNVRDFVKTLWDQDNDGRVDTAVELLIRLRNTPQGLIVRTPTGSTKTLQPNGQPLRLQAQDIIFDEAGFVTIYVENPTSQPVMFDLVALGPARTP